MNKVRLTPSERSFLNREEYLLRQIRLLELENQAAELSRKLEGPATGLPQLDSAALSAVAAIDEPANNAPPFRLISVWGQGVRTAQTSWSTGFACLYPRERSLVTAGAWSTSHATRCRSSVEANALR